MKKIIIIFIILIIFFVIISYFFLFSSKNNIENNIVKITKTSEISNIQNNPLWIFWEQKNIWENTFNGFFIDKNTIITVEHWLSKSEKKIKIIDKFWNNYYWEIILRDKKNDFAIIKTNKSFKNFSKIKLSEKINNWQKIKSISFDKIKFWEIKKIENNKIFSDIIFESWESGSVIIDKKNNLVWINIWNDLSKNMWISNKINQIIAKQ